MDLKYDSIVERLKKQVGDLQEGKSIVDESDLQSEAIFNQRSKGLKRPRKKVLLDDDEDDLPIDPEGEDNEVKKRKIKERQKREADIEIEQRYKDEAENR